MNVVLTKVNEVFMTVECDDGLARDLFDFFSFTVPNAKFMPSYKNRMWDGKIRLFSIKTKQIYIGLLPYIVRFCEERDYEIEDYSGVLGDGTYLSESQIDSFIKEVKLPFEPRDYQIEAFSSAVEYGRKLLLSPTASGKSLIIYLLTRWYGLKTVVIVPTTSLVEQMSKDFEDYGYTGDICKMYSGQKYFESDITITTWQTFSKAPKDVMQSYDVVIGDEAHGFKANVLKGIMEKLTTTAIRIGTTGTLDGTEVHRLQLEGMFGPVKKVITTSQLMEDGTVAELNIDCIVLNHKKQPKMSYQDEMDYLVSCDARNAFITNLVASLSGNTLVLFQYVEKHGAVLQKMLEDRVDNLHYVYGKTHTDDREQVRHIVEEAENDVILASYGTFSTGINIKKIDNVVFASPSKSRIRNLQSIGRGLRKSKEDDKVRLFDISDNLQNGNYTLNHFKERINIYNEENFSYQILQFDLSE